jgi:hypothetical protein
LQRKWHPRINRLNPNKIYNKKAGIIFAIRKRIRLNIPSFHELFKSRFSFYSQSIGMFDSKR